MIFYARIQRRGTWGALLLASWLVLTGCAGPSQNGHFAPVMSISAHESDNQATLRQKIVQLAASMLGAPYRYGGTTPNGFDCSGLVYYSYTQAGLKIPRTTLAQYQGTTPVSVSELLPGDLVFFRLNGRAISHVGIYQGDNKFIHAPIKGKQVSEASLHNRYWRQRFVRGGRFL